jgi:hypothetical protein
MVECLSNMCKALDIIPRTSRIHTHTHTHTHTHAYKVVLRKGGEKGKEERNCWERKGIRGKMTL